MAKLTVHQAAKQGWPTRPTLYRAIKNGRISAEKDAEGRIVLDPAELVRVFGEPVTRQERKAERDTARDDAQLDRLRAALGRAEKDAAEAREQLARERAERDRERDRLLSIIERAALPPPRRPFWRRIFGSEGQAAG